MNGPAETFPDAAHSSNSKDAAASAGAGLAGVFEVTPHKMAVCHLIEVFAPPTAQQVSNPFGSVAAHNRLGLFLFSIIRSSDNFLEPSLEVLLNQLKVVCRSDDLCEHLTTNLSNMSSPDDLFNFFDRLRGVLLAPEGGIMDDQIFLDPSSQLGVFLRCCILAFNLLNFEGVCHLLTSLAIYCNSTGTYGLSEDAHSNNDLEMSDLLDSDLDLQTSIFNKYGPGFDVEPHLRESFSCFQDLTPVCAPSEENICREEDNIEILRSKWQIDEYLNQQACHVEKELSPHSTKSLGAILTRLQKLAPELHRVHYLQYLNALHHYDYIDSLDNLHRYFDYSAGMEGLFCQSPAPPHEILSGKYETALLCLGTTQFRFGHAKKALEALTEALRISQQNNDDSCLAYTLAAICSLLSEMGISSAVGMIDSPFSTETNIGLGTPSSLPQQLLVLLKRSIKRAESLKYMGLLAFNHLALAKFYLKHIQRPLLSFGPTSSTTLRTCPVDVCKELSLSSRVLNEFGSEALSMSNDNGAFSTSWIRNVTNLTAPSPPGRTHVSLNDFDVFQFNAQPSPVPGSVLQLAGATYLLRAASWEHYGSSSLARMNSLVYTTCFADAASSSELSLAYLKLIQQLASTKGHSEALKALRIAESKFSSLSKQQIQLLKLQLLHDRALHRGHLKAAKQICDDLGTLASSLIGVDMDIKTEAEIRKSRTLLSENQFDQAAAVANSLFCTCYKFNMQIQNASVLLLFAEIHKKSGNAVLGLPYALASISFCKAFNLDLLEASATLTLAELWLSLGSSHAYGARHLLQRALPMILGQGGLELRSRANIALAKCHLADPNFSVSKDLDFVLDSLNQAAEELEILEYHEMAAEAFYLKAMVCNKLEMFREREEAAISFREHVLALENPQMEEESLRV